MGLLGKVALATGAGVGGYLLYNAYEQDPAAYNEAAYQAYTSAWDGANAARDTVQPYLSTAQPYLSTAQSYLSTAANTAREYGTSVWSRVSEYAPISRYASSVGQSVASGWCPEATLGAVGLGGAGVLYSLWPTGGGHSGKASSQGQYSGSETDTQSALAAHSAQSTGTFRLRTKPEGDQQVERTRDQRQSRAGRLFGTRSHQTGRTATARAAAVRGYPVPLGKSAQIQYCRPRREGAR